MVKDDQMNVPSVPPPAAASRPGLLLGKIAMVAAVLVGAAVLGFAYRWLRPTDYAGATEKPADKDKAAPKPPALFKRWPADRKPDFAFLLTGEMFGYIQPCGCSSPQYGGLARRWNFVQKELKGRGWPVVALDLGDVAQRSGPQTKLKYTYSMKALKKLGYLAMGTGTNEFALPLQDALAIYTLNEGKPWPLAANLKDRENAFFNCVKAAHVTTAEESPVRIGVIGIVSPSVIDQVRDPAAKFDSTKQALAPAIKALSQSEPEMYVLLYQGSLEEARALAKAYREFSVILALSKEEEPREDPVKEGNTLIINVGHKGRKVGVLGAFRNPKGSAQKFDFHYQLCSIGPEYETPKGQEAGNEIHALLEEYAKEVKSQNFLAQHARTKHPIQLDPRYTTSVYVGSEKCKKCHEEAYRVWAKSPHSHSYKTLVDSDRPGLRQYDPECAVCHVTALNYVGGFMNENATPHLQDNGCENCHGPASMHLKNTADTNLHALMNPFKPKPNETAAQRERRMNALDQACQKCHDIDNDVNWNINKWNKIVHREIPGTLGKAAPPVKP